MSNPYQPPQPGQPVPPQPVPAQPPGQDGPPSPGQAAGPAMAPASPAPKKKGRVAPALITGIIALVIGIAIGNAGDGGAQTASPGAPGATVTATTTTTVTAPAAPAPETSKAPPADATSLKASDFKVTLKIKSKECFGSAGCNLTFGIKPQYVGKAELPDTGTVEVSYEVTGGDSGPILNTFTVSGGTANYDAEGSVQTASSSTKLKVKVTDVSYDPDN